MVRQLIGVTGQYASVDETLSATENLVVFGRLLGLSRTEAKRKSTEPNKARKTADQDSSASPASRKPRTIARSGSVGGRPSVRR